MLSPKFSRNQRKGRLWRIPVWRLSLALPLTYLVIHVLLYRKVILQEELPTSITPQPKQPLKSRSNFIHEATEDRGAISLRSNFHPPLWKSSVLPDANTTRSLHTCHNRQHRKIVMPAIPDFIIIGMQKAGTSAIYVILSEHPNIYLPKRFEAHFFTRRMRSTLEQLQHYPNLLCETRKQYANLLLDEQLQLNVSKPWFTFEKTPAYVVSEHVPELIQQVTPWAKVIVVLRHPSDRVYSHFKMKYDRQEFPEHSTFNQALTVQLHELVRQGMVDPKSIPDWLHENSSTVEDGYQDERGWKFSNLLYRSYYADQLREWMDHFTLGESLYVIRYERLDEDPQAVMDEMLDFLQIPRYNFSSEIMEERYNPNRQDPLNITAPFMPNATRAFLDGFFAPWNDELADMLGEEWRGVWKEEF